eukprot:Blabericola_migrator_1__6546@NODE_32_length_18281_cov_109_908422_g28_i0_p9_GENE_NODE_32_length_18281_cov_109_908422_g28_i0NODE_32_length_18281_cov_109_908422_g28_i0_p9_ORF_typecomplete_len195_score7_92_NODE_32_length_18281_cov_109_908422_g28_i021942778
MIYSIPKGSQPAPWFRGATASSSASANFISASILSFSISKALRIANKLSPRSTIFRIVDNRVRNMSCVDDKKSSANFSNLTRGSACILSTGIAVFKSLIESTLATSLPVTLSPNAFSSFESVVLLATVSLFCVTLLPCDELLTFFVCFGGAAILIVINPGSEAAASAAASSSSFSFNLSSKDCLRQQNRFTVAL